MADNLAHHLVAPGRGGRAICVYCRQTPDDLDFTERTCPVKWEQEGKPDHRAEPDGQVDQGESCTVCALPVIKVAGGYLHTQALTDEIGRRLDVAEVAVRRPIIVTLPDGQQVCVRRWPDGTPDVMWRATPWATWNPVHQDQWSIGRYTYEEREQ